jgi:UDP-N-acetylglucosamine 4,6-dehydratase
MNGGEIFVPKIPSMKIIDLAKAICPNCRQEITGIRAGEKLHETLVPKDDGIYTAEFKDRYVTYPNIILHGKKTPGGKPVGFDFDGYRSDNNTQWLSVEQLKKMAEE